MATCEAELIARAAHGDQKAFRQLWEAHHPAAMAAALRLCHQRALAEEITQGAFLLAWRGLPRFHTGSPFRPWLLRILYHHGLDVLERQRMHGQSLPLDEAWVPESPVAEEHQQTQADPQEEVTQRETVRQALAHLSAEQRRVIALRYGADLTEEDIAQVLGWPVGTVKSRLHRAREQLRLLLSEEER